VSRFIQFYDKSYVEDLIKKRANLTTKPMTVNTSDALRELGLQLTRDEADVVFETADTDENGGLNFKL
jgi:Ca2+-binding EF-hand superfamily protein